jgi:hypothetical protein
MNVISHLSKLIGFQKKESFFSLFNLRSADSADNASLNLGIDPVFISLVYRQM